MIFKDISQDKKTLYTLNENERIVFFMLNRSGEITFELAGSGAEAHIFSFFIGKNTDKGTLKIFQKHLAPKTISHALIKSVLSDEAAVAYEGSIFMNKQAIQGDASQESRAILLSPGSKVSMKPTLEILADDVCCRHAATAGPISQESLFFAQSRGLSKTQARHLLIVGFIKSSLDKMKELISSQDNARIMNLESRITDMIKSSLHNS